MPQNSFFTNRAMECNQKTQCEAERSNPGNLLRHHQSPRKYVRSSAFRRKGGAEDRLNDMHILPPEGGTTNATFHHIRASSARHDGSAERKNHSKLISIECKLECSHSLHT